MTTLSKKTRAVVFNFQPRSLVIVIQHRNTDEPGKGYFDYCLTRYAMKFIYLLAVRCKYKPQETYF